MALITVVKYDGPADVLAWKYPDQELGTWTQLIVNESQEALLFMGGQALDVFPAGRHTLSTQNIPILTSIVKLPFGGKSPFTAEVWFVNKLRTLNIKWGTAAPIQLKDPVYQVPVSVRAFGQFGIQIEDTRSFLTKLIGTVEEYDQATLGKHFRAVMMMNINELISSYLIHKKISILEINAYVGEISKHIEERIAPVFQSYGIRLVNFHTDSINIPESDSVTARLKEALAKKAEMDILGYTYHQERTFDTLQSAAQNEAASGTFMGVGIGMEMGAGIGGTMGRTMSELSRQASAPASGCSKCGHPITAGSKFCSNCGDPYHPCAACGADNPANARSCAKCGQAMAGGCRHCGVSITQGAKFCPECGQSQTLQCSSCKQEFRPGEKFCKECGHKLG